eukprot:388985-Pelagomonas_calceolata.AAC.6
MLKAHTSASRATFLGLARFLPTASALENASKRVVAQAPFKGGFQEGHAQSTHLCQGCLSELGLLLCLSLSPGFGQPGAAIPGLPLPPAVPTDNPGFQNAWPCSLLRGPGHRGTRAPVVFFVTAQIRAAS